MRHVPRLIHRDRNEKLGEPVAVGLTEVHAVQFRPGGINGRKIGTQTISNFVALKPIGGTARRGAGRQMLRRGRNK